MTAVLKRIGGPTIKCRNRFRSIEIVGQVLAHPGDGVGGVRAGRQGGRGAPAGQPGGRFVEHLLAPKPVRAVVPGQQTQPNGRRLNTFGA